MNPRVPFLAGIPIFIFAALLTSSPVLAEKPSWAGKGERHANKDERGEKSARRFEDHHRAAVRDYYSEEFRGGHCPPGLAKKHNGCMPPGQAKKWRVGRPLPREVAIYEVPSALVVKLGVPPAGYKYVRVASDILMIAAGTNMVADAIRDLGRR